MDGISAASVAVDSTLGAEIVPDGLPSNSVAVDDFLSGLESACGLLIPRDMLFSMSGSQETVFALVGLLGARLPVDGLLGDTTILLTTMKKSNIQLLK